MRYTHLPRAQNLFANAIATLASMVNILVNVVIHPLLIELKTFPAYFCMIGETKAQGNLPWYYDIHYFLRFGIYPSAASTKDRRTLRQLATRFVICGKSLYKHLAYGILLLCLDQASIDRVMREVHARVCELHMEGHMLARKC